MAVFVGVDQALRKTGVCVLAENEPHLALIEAPDDLKGPERLAYLRTALQDFLHPYQGQITKAAMEGASHGSLGDLQQLNHISGVQQVVLTDLGAPPLIVPPGSLKKFVSGNGQASKAQMQTATERFWGIEIEDDNVCDAHGLARFAQEVTESASELRHQVEAVYTVMHRKKRRSPIRKVLPPAV